MSTYILKSTIALIALFTVFNTAALSQLRDLLYLEGQVLDSAGLPVTGAEIEIKGSGRRTACITNNQGNFKCELEATENLELTIRADGFLILRYLVANIQEYNGFHKFRLEPEAIREEVPVTILKAESSISDSPASIGILKREEITRTASTSVDDVLRQSVGFSLFRRSGSQTANPTTQGASLRGINSSGASRSQVLFDGIALNDPFGGWIVWNRVPKIGVERIEILRGGSSALFGSGSLGGTIEIIPRKVDESGADISAELSVGNSKLFDGSVFSGFTRAGWSFDIAASIFQTKGYQSIETISRGVVDDYSNSRNTNLLLRAERKSGEFIRYFSRASFFGEGRNNGTPVQKNRTHIRDFLIGTEIGFGRFSSAAKNTRLIAKFFGGNQVFDQTFSSIFADRSGESLVRLQRVPAQRFGISTQIFSHLGKHSLVFGFESVEVRGSSNETGYFGGRATSQIGSGGRERKIGLFFQDFVRINEKFTIAGAIRFDHWKNYRGLSSVRNLNTNLVTTELFNQRSENTTSPSVSMLYRLSNTFSAYVLTGRSFRSPTLNELYRGFRVGSVVTDPNAFLRAEKAWNLEGGIRFNRESVLIQANVFRTSISNAIANVTIDSGPPLILRQRRNAGETVTKGLEIEAEYRTGILSLRAGFLAANSKVTSFATDIQLVGRRVPQVPARQFTFQVSVTPNNKWNVAFQGRAASSQFDDDANTFILEKYFQGDMYVSRKISERLSLFIAVENVFNSRYSIGRTPTRTVSAPFGIRGGFRWN